MTGLVGAALGFVEQRFPFGAWQPAFLKIGAGIFAAMVEETDIIIFLFKRLDLCLYETVEFGQIGLQVLWNVKVHMLSLSGGSSQSLGQVLILNQIK